ncbi:hypothetical protein DSAG12_01523 [Promethearchaeum syntrophicum]|uniref:DUF4405 domain-containing protein n=1 Tax=Promethearchaeum syntrophicum TaxID=2594042 RepID=A0A5B9DAR3_9ARCH|nr:hypothetical protein [Candidatus Prometheoarchaeum syntrophicum]QEE15696.1 hypothetical protein DSAG12_01523 [Candidatus Prometheoarchaeum syntrophicum]
MRNSRNRKIHQLRILQRITSWLILISVSLVVLTGLHNYQWFSLTLGQFFLFKYHSVVDGFLTIFILIHSGLGAIKAIERKKEKFDRNNIYVYMIMFLLIGGTVYLEVFPYILGNDSISQNPSNILESESIVIGDQVFNFNPLEIQTIREDLFKNGSFSVFDILVYLDNLGQLDLDYHFNGTLNTYVIDNLEQQNLWWYKIKYSGGWDEKNVFRMDHYPWKVGSSVTLQPASKSTLDQIYATYLEENERLVSNNGTVIIPKVEINGRTINYNFYNVTINPHNLRNDTFQEGVITAIDIIMSLVDQGLISSYNLQWYDEIGTAEFVRSYWVEGIENDNAYGTCGFVYESGDTDFPFFDGNHIHLPSDTRILNNPEYSRWFWICL